MKKIARAVYDRLIDHSKLFDMTVNDYSIEGNFSVHTAYGLFVKQVKHQIIVLCVYFLQNDLLIHSKKITLSVLYILAIFLLLSRPVLT